MRRGADPGSSPVLLSGGRLEVLSAAALILLLLLFLPLRRGAAQTLPCPGNRLANPGFEQGFSGRGTVTRSLASGWLDWQERSRRQAELLPSSRLRQGEDAVRSGLWSQALRDLAPLQAGGVWQRVPVPVGATIRAQAWGRSRLGRGGGPSGYLLSLGLDPRGGSDPMGEGVRWTAPVTATDTWLPLFLEVESEAGQVSLFLRGRPLDPVANEALWDEACLRTEADVDPPTPSPGPPPASPEPLAEGQPSPTPGLATLEAQLRAQSRATVRAFELVQRATQRAATPPASARSLAFSPIGGPVSAAGGAGASGVERADRRAVRWWQRLYDRAGLVALILAALTAGILLGLGRGRRGAA